jgi:glycopeptide antibiotics resistance protein
MPRPLRTELANTPYGAQLVHRAAGFGLLAQLGLIVLATLMPFQLALPARFALDFEVRASDLALNLVMLAPLGFLAALRFGLGPARGLVLGALLSATLELLQLFVPARCPSLYDVAMNALGAGVGALLYALAPERSARFIEKLVTAPPSFERGAVITLALLALALGLLHRGTDFHWTLGLAPLAGDCRAIVLGSIASLSLAGWLGYTLPPGAPAWLAAAWTLPIAAGLELCRGFSASHVASLTSLLLTLIVALGAARLRDAVEGWRFSLR